MTVIATRKETGHIADFVELTKPRITSLVAFTCLVGFVVAKPGPVDGFRLCLAVLGTALVAAGASALNMVFERDTDALMQRTKGRPLPEGRLGVPAASTFSALLSASGLALLAVSGGLLAAGVALATWGSYLFLYTPLKRRTSLATLVGAVPGALPPVIGWAAATGALDRGAALLFAVVFLWQIPHFLAIAWLYRDDYALAGLPMLPVIDPDGLRTATQALAHTVALLALSLMLPLAGLAGHAYLVGALLLGVALSVAALLFLMRRSSPRARVLFLASLVYLPVLSMLLLANRS